MSGTELEALQKLFAPSALARPQSRESLQHMNTEASITEKNTIAAKQWLYAESRAIRKLGGQGDNAYDLLLGSMQKISGLNPLTLKKSDGDTVEKYKARVQDTVASLLLLSEPAEVAHTTRLDTNGILRIYTSLIDKEDKAAKAGLTALRGIIANNMHDVIAATKVFPEGIHAVAKAETIDQLTRSELNELVSGAIESIRQKGRSVAALSH